MRKLLYTLSLVVLTMTGHYTFAQVSVTGAPYAQEFDALVAAGTNNPWSDNTTIPGWYATRVAYNAGTGSSNTGALYSFGTTPERALGSVVSGSTGTIYYGVRLKNNTLQSISSIQVNYTGEQWRMGGNATPHSLLFAWRSGSLVDLLTVGTWTPVSQLNFTGPIASATPSSGAALNGNDPLNRQAISFLVTGLSVAPGQEIMLRWEDINDGGNDHGLAIDGLSLSFNFIADTEAPTASFFSPSNGSVGVALNPTASITFSENINAGTGNIYVKQAADNSTVQTIDATTATITNNSASFAISGLATLTDYYIQVDNGAFTDLAGNPFAGISDITTWRFQTLGPAGSYSWNFNACTSPGLDGGFTQFSYETAAANDSVWKCSDFGRGSGKSIQMNAGTTGLPNQDWLISPALDLSAYNIPMLRFYSRNRFEGPGLQLKVSTNYSGTGDPAAATWTSLTGKFPDENTDRWSLSDSINLSAYKQAGVYLAWVYNTSALEGPRWQVDDVNIFNSTVAGAPYTKAFGYYKNLGIAAAGSPGPWRKITFDAADIADNVTITVPTGFEVSKDGISGGPTVLLTPAEGNGAGKELFVRLNPGTDNTDFSGTLSFTATNLALNYPVFGSSQTATNTLDIICWNIEWFGGSQGPVDNDLQQTNVQQALQYLNADVYALEEVVDIARLNTVVGNLTGYASVVSDYGSLAPDPSSPQYATAQKLALVYKTSVLSNVQFRGLMKSSATAVSNWASGRVPFLVNADVTINSVTRNINFIVLHGKAGDALSDYNARKAGTDELKDTLDAQFSTANTIILGDYNDDLDLSISTPNGGGPVTSYTTLIGDSTDADSYRSLSLPLSKAGLRSTKANSDVIDHVVISNELQVVFLSGSVQLRKDLEDVITEYPITTSDHYPVVSRFNLSATLPVSLTGFAATLKNNAVLLTWKTVTESNSKEFIVERSTDGKKFTTIGKVAAAGHSATQLQYQFTDKEPVNGNNFYRLKPVDLDGKTTTSPVVKVVVGKKTAFSFAPNPAKGKVTISIDNSSTPVTVQLTDLNGRLLRQQVIPAHQTTATFHVQGVGSGVFLLKVLTLHGTQTEKIVIE